MVTIFKNIFSKEPHYLPISKCLSRIKEGKSKNKVLEIRQQLDKERASKLKSNLPSVCFSGKFGSNRSDNELIEHSGYLVLDFDDIENPQEKKQELIKYQFVRACWVSPSGNGVKALVRIKNPDKHKEHFRAIQEIMPYVDKSGINPSRVCYESYDPELLENPKPIAFDKTIIIEYQEVKPTLNQDDTFDKILKWLTNKGDAFRTGERNLFLYKLASACCRFGIQEDECLSRFNTAFLTNDNDFTRSEAQRTVKSAYRANMSLFGSAEFNSGILIDKKIRKEVEVDGDIYNTDIKPKDVIFGEDVKGEALEIFNNGYQSASTTFVPELDEFFKWKRGEITLLTGIGNYGKSTFLKYLLLLQVLYEGKKFALFSPEDNPAAEFYHDLVEIYFGTNCTPEGYNRPPQEEYEAVYDFISNHIFYVYPKTIAPTPEYIKERFLELIIKEKIDGCVIDPFNQLTNDYASHGGRSDKYLEFLLSDFSRFAQSNQVLFMMVAHPKAMRKEKDSLNYPEPDVFDIADGAMWNNKMDNILVYHRPERGENPESNLCTLSSKKIRRQKIVGRLGTLEFHLTRAVRRYTFNGNDYIGQVVSKMQKLRDEIF